MFEYKTVSETSLKNLISELNNEKYGMPWFGDAGVHWLWISLYGDRIVNPSITEYLNYPSPLDLQIVAQMLCARYSYKWAHLWETTKIEYDPTENHNITDKSVRTNTGSATGSGTNSVETYVVPFNASVPTQDGTNKTTNTNTTTTDNSETENITHTGFTGDSVQNLLRDERKTADFKFYDIVLHDMAELLTLSVY